MALEDIPEEGAPDEIADPDLQQALSRLDDEERRIVVLKYFEEEKLQTIARVMDLNVSTVKSRLYRAVEKLKRYMEPGDIRPGSGGSGNRRRSVETRKNGRAGAGAGL